MIIIIVSYFFSGYAKPSICSIYKRKLASHGHNYKIQEKMCNHCLLHTPGLNTFCDLMILRMNKKQKNVFFKTLILFSVPGWSECLQSYLWVLFLISKVCQLSELVLWNSLAKIWITWSGSGWFAWFRHLS